MTMPQFQRLALATPLATRILTIDVESAAATTIDLKTAGFACADTRANFVDSEIRLRPDLKMQCQGPTRVFIIFEHSKRVDLNERRYVNKAVCAETLALVQLEIDSWRVRCGDILMESEVESAGTHRMPDRVRKIVTWTTFDDPRYASKRSSVVVTELGASRSARLQNHEWVDYAGPVRVCAESSRPASLHIAIVSY
ncbi:hypothetical protein MRB53_042370 [Persea americana]|nr:hypothetical protein MRB53_042370 [Persea americana]